MTTHDTDADRVAPVTRTSSSPDHRPPGWDTNPSSWRQRLPIVVLALAGVAVAGWLALYQQEITDTVWEPFFDGGAPRRPDPRSACTRRIVLRQCNPTAQVHSLRFGSLPQVAMVSRLVGGERT